MKQILMAAFFLMGFTSFSQTQIFCSAQTKLFTEISGEYNFKTRLHEQGQFAWMVEGPVKVLVTPFNEIGSNQAKSWRGRIALTEIPEPGTITPATITAVVTTLYRVSGRHFGSDTTNQGTVYNYQQNLLCTENAVHNCGGWHTLVEKIDTQTIALEIVSLQVTIAPETICENGYLQPQLKTVTPATGGTLIWQLPWGKFEGPTPPPAPWQPEYEGATIKVVLDIEGIRYQALSTVAAGSCDCSAADMPTSLDEP